MAVIFSLILVLPFSSAFLVSIFKSPSKCHSFSFHKAVAVFCESIQNKQSWKEMSLWSYLAYCLNLVPACAFEMNLLIVTMSCALLPSKEQFLVGAQTGFLLVKGEVEGALLLVSYIHRLPKYHKFLWKCAKSQKKKMLLAWRLS